MSTKMERDPEIDMAPRRKKKKPFKIWSRWIPSEQFNWGACVRGLYATEKQRDHALATLKDKEQWANHRYAKTREELEEEKDVKS